MTILLPKDVTQIAKDDAINLKKGDVILVRSNYAYDKYGDHFSLIVGGKIQKDRGLRPNLIAFPATVVYQSLLDSYNPIDGSIILKLSNDAATLIIKAYGIYLSEGELVSI